MIDPVIFTIRLGGLELPIRWYGVLIVAGVLIGTWIVEREVQRRREDLEFVWDALFWVLPAGVIGARIWYVLNDIVGGGRAFIENPLRILNIPEGGLHIFGAILFGGLAAYLFARRYRIDIWLMMDSVAPVLLIGQAIARPANFINQELYGPPTDLPWGISISADRRLAPWNDLSQYPEETTRFHPTFAYEMLWNILAAGFLLWLSRRFKNRLKPGTMLAGWLVLAGVGRFLIEFFRPDQPRILGTEISFSRVVAALMAVLGGLWLLARYEVIRLPAFNFGPEQYTIRTKRQRRKGLRRRTRA